MSKKQTRRKRQNRRAKPNKECLWMGTARLGNIQFFAVSLEKLKPRGVGIASIPFYSIPIKRLDALYKVGKRTLLGIQ